MEDDRTKKKNKKKKKKNKQAATTPESVTIDGTESTCDRKSYVAGQDNDEKQISVAADASNDVGRKMDEDTDGHLSNGIEETDLAKAERQYWIDKEENFKEKIKQLLSEKDAQMQKEAILEGKIKELLKEKDENLQKLASQEETIRQLHSAKISFIQKEDTLEERIKQLQGERDGYLQKENSAKESTEALHNNCKTLQAQVMELEESREALLKEKEELTEKLSSLQLEIKNLESIITYHLSDMNNNMNSEDGNVDHSHDMHGLAGKVPENSELDEKVNGMYKIPLSVGSNSGDVAALSAGFADSSACTQDFAFGAEGRKCMPESDSTRSLEEVMLQSERNSKDANCKDGSELENSPKGIVEADEIVQIPLGESQLDDTSLEVDENNEVSLVDAPLIGAPFRFISFVARYVSGADLVNKNAVNSV